MFASVLIANRGEIACRIARTASRLGLRTIAVYSDADRDALHVQMCDEAHRIGPAPARESYLSVESLIAVARRSRAACIHPGYGFLSEHADFAEACAAAGIVFIGPPPGAIRDMGLKDRAKALMEKAGVPVVSGYHGGRQDVAFLKEQAALIGYPVFVKAIAGGGGRGMRRVEGGVDFDAALEAAQREAQAAFGDAGMLVEKFIAAPRHIEMQFFADSHGHAIHLNERDCSLQRRHQKVIEEAPAPGMTPELRARMGAVAVQAAKAVGYVGAGTVEFIVDAARGLRPDGFWFMEMNTRLQVEHPVTEAITGLDLVEWQFRIAAGEPLPLTQEQVPLRGHAVEARLYAEDTERGFLPSAGRLLVLELPSGESIRVDTGVAAGSEITPYYDPMIAKVIAHAETRQAALDRLAEALDCTVAVGPRTNIALLAALCRAEGFRTGAFDTGFIERHAAAGGEPKRLDRAAAARGAAMLLAQETAQIAQERLGAPPSPWDTTDGFQLSGRRSLAVPVVVDGEIIQAQAVYGVGGLRMTVDGIEADADAVAVETPDAIYIVRNGLQTVVRRPDFGLRDDRAGGGGSVIAPMHGKVLAVLAGAGDRVVKGQRLATIEAMKMEHTLTAPRTGVVADVTAAPGSQVVEGTRIMTILAEHDRENGIAVSGQDRVQTQRSEGAGSVKPNRARENPTD